MHSSFEKEWQKLERSSLYYWDLLQQQPPEVLVSKPTALQWSLLQIMEHLAASEKVTLQYLVRKDYATLQSRSIMPAPLRAFLLRLALRSPLKFKVPAVPGLQPANTTESQLLLSNWQQNREKLREYIDHVPINVIGKPLFRHPRAGALSLKQTLQFLRDHLDHHQPQAARLMQLKYPPATFKR